MTEPIRFKHWLCALELARYRTPPHPIAILLGSAERKGEGRDAVFPGSPISVATVYLEGAELGPTEVAIKSWEENEGMADCLQAAGVIGPAKRRLPTGFVEATVHDLLIPPPPPIPQ